MSAPDLNIVTPADVRFIFKGQDAVAYWFNFLAPTLDPAVESGAVLLLDSERRVLGYVVVTNKARRWVDVPPALVFRAATALGANAVVVLHSHPADEPDPTPSTADHDHALQLLACSRILLIELADYVIVGARNGQADWVSFRDEGLFTVAKEVREDVNDKAMREAWWRVTAEVLAGKPALEALVYEAAAKLNLAPDDYFRQFITRAIAERFVVPPIDDARVAFAAEVVEKDPAMLEGLAVKAKAAGKGVIDFLWESQVSSARDRFRSENDQPKEICSAPAGAGAPVGS